MAADVRKGIWISVDKERLHGPISLLFESHLFLKVGREVRGRSRDFSIASCRSVASDRAYRPT